MIYKITSIKDREGRNKKEFYQKLKSVHPTMTGEILYPILDAKSGCLCFAWNDDSNKMLRTSPIQEFSNVNGTIEVISENSIYTLKSTSKNKL